jgi:hypothetical protein
MSTAAPLVTELETWLRKQRVKLSAKNEVAKAITYSLNQWRGLVRFLDDGHIEQRGGACATPWTRWPVRRC